MQDIMTDVDDFSLSVSIQRVRQSAALKITQVTKFKGVVCMIRSLSTANLGDNFEAMGVTIVTMQPRLSNQ